MLVLAALAIVVNAQIATAQTAAAQIAPPPANTPLDPGALTYAFIDKAIAEGRVQSAAKLIQQAEVRGADPELDLRKAELLLATGALKDAEAGFRLLEQNPVLAARAKVGRAIIQINSGGQDEAAELLLQQALSADPLLARGWSARAVIADRRRDWVASEDYYRRGLAVDPQSAVLLNNRGYSRMLQGRYADAEADFAAALKLQPDLAEALTNLRLARGLQGRYAEAFEGASRKDLARDLNNVGVAAMLRGEHQLAESYFSRAIEMNGRHDPTASANLAYVQKLAQESAERQKPRK